MIYKDGHAVYYVCSSDILNIHAFNIMKGDRSFPRKKMKDIKKIMAGVLAVSMCASAASVYADSDIITLTMTTSANSSEANVSSVENKEDADNSETKIVNKEDILTVIEKEDTKEDTEDIDSAVKEIIDNSIETGKLTDAISYYVTEDGKAAIVGFGAMEGETYNSSIAAFKKAVSNYKVEKLYICNDKKEPTDEAEDKSTEELTITSVGEGLLSGISTNCIASVVLPDGIKRIEKNAFYGCSALTEINMPDSLGYIGAGAFAYCAGLTEISIPDSVTKIENEAFYYCSGLEKAVVGSGIKTSLNSKEAAFAETDNVIGHRVFGYCTSLKDLTIPCTNGTLVDICFSNTISSPLEKLTFTGEGTIIPNASCYKYTKLKSVTLPETVETIGNQVFAYCESLEEINMPSKLVSIGDEAFRNSKITSVVLPDGLKTIGAGAFAYCAGITEINIPDSVTKIGNEVFYYCSGLEKAVVGSGIKASLSSKEESFTKTDNVIGHRVFGYCSKLKDLTIPCTNGTLVDICFSNTISSPLEKLTFTGEGTFIPENSCYNYAKLNTVTIPTSVNTVEKGAFNACNALETVYYDGTDDDWAAIDIKEKNDPLINAARMHSPKQEFMYGDIDKNGVVELTDLTYLSLYLMQSAEFDEVQVLAADVDGNGIVDIADLARLKQYICHDVNVKVLGPKN